MASGSHPDPATLLAGHRSVREDYGEATPLSRSDADARAREGDIPKPDGWTLGDAVDATLAVEIRDGGKPVSRSEVPTTKATLVRGDSETVWLEIARIEDTAARTWADWVNVDRPYQEVPGGRAYASGPCFSIDWGDRLLRVAYWDGQPAAGREGDLQAKAHALISAFT
jgi:hypothetical protein